MPSPRCIPASNWRSAASSTTQAFPPLPAILADGAGSGTIVYGPAIDDWRTRDIAGQEVDAVVQRQGSAAKAPPPPRSIIRWCRSPGSPTNCRAPASA